MDVQALVPLAQGPSDAEVVARVLAGDTRLFEVLMRRHNRRLHRAARSVLGDDQEAEDVVQEGYVRAWAHLGRLEAGERVGAWLTRIVVHEALARLRRRGRWVDLETEPPDALARGPEQYVADRELAHALEAAVDALPVPFRTVFMLRAVEGLSTSETAASLGLPEETVKTRLHRARRLLRAELALRVDEAADRLFAFDGARCDRLVATVLARLTALERAPAFG